MFNIGQFKIITTNTHFIVNDPSGNALRKFTVTKYDLEHVRTFREGYVKALNDTEAAKGY